MMPCCQAALAKNFNEVIYLLSCWLTCLLWSEQRESSVHWLVLYTPVKIFRNVIFNLKNANNDLSFVTNAIFFLSHINKWTEPQTTHIWISLCNSLASIPCYNLLHSIKSITINLFCNYWMKVFRLRVGKPAAKKKNKKTMGSIICYKCEQQINS